MIRPLIVLALVTLGQPAAAAGFSDAARVHYERGMSKYNLADFDAAVDEFKQSYELSKAPRLLFNIAQAYRLKKDWERALFFYSTYLRNEPHAPNREDVEMRIDEMRQKHDEQQQAPPSTTPSPSLSSAPTPAPTPGTTPLLSPLSGAAYVAPSSGGPSPRRLRIAGLATMGAGLAVAAVGAGLFGLANSDANTVRAVIDRGGLWSSDLQHSWDEGTRSQSAAIALVAVGGAAAAAGAIVTALGFRAAKQQLALELGPSRIGLQGRF